MKKPGQKCEVKTYHLEGPKERKYAWERLSEDRYCKNALVPPYTILLNFNFRRRSTNACQSSWNPLFRALLWSRFLVFISLALSRKWWMGFVKLYGLVLRKYHGRKVVIVRLGSTNHFITTGSNTQDFGVLKFGIEVESHWRTPIRSCIVDDAQVANLRIHI